MSLAGFGGVLVWARRGIVEQRRWMTRGRVQRNLRAVPFPARSEHRQSLGGVRLARSRHSRRRGRLCRAGRAADADRDHVGRGLCALWRDRCVAADRLPGVACAAVGLLIAVVFKMMTPLIEGAMWPGSSCSSRCSSPSACSACRCRRCCWWRFRSSLALTILQRRRAA